MTFHIFIYIPKVYNSKQICTFLPAPTYIVSFQQLNSTPKKGNKALVVKAGVKFTFLYQHGLPRLVKDSSMMSSATRKNACNWNNKHYKWIPTNGSFAKWVNIKQTKKFSRAYPFYTPAKYNCSFHIIFC